MPIMKYALLLVKPVKQVCAREDWFVEDLDVKQFKSWDIKEICSDGS